MNVSGWPWSLRRVVKGQPDRLAARKRLRLLRHVLESADDWQDCRDRLNNDGFGIDTKSGHGTHWIFVQPTLKIAFKVTEFDSIRWDGHRAML